ncbi:hypothetical protein JHK82_034794 [Glycine max]|nr:hypothetical protein JHK85_035502 [Glycine max]KAG5120374.1 hypothetical protein JHK82_034794 [Glycine max]KAH1222958.1 Protein NEOXANTHIN-DEFICIENT 1 [Glycine max]
MFSFMSKQKDTEDEVFWFIHSFISAYFSFEPNLATLLLLSPNFHQFHIHSLHLGAKIHSHNFPFASFIHFYSHQTQSYFMEAVEAKSSSGYGKPPWVFRGRQVAWYQLDLVKAEKARAYIPKEFKLVEAFG